MPLSELYRMAKGKFESSQKKSSYSEDPSFRPDGDFFELVWGNGQFLVQDSSSKARKSPNNDNSPAHAVPSHSPNSKDFRNVTKSRMENFGSIDTILNDFHLSEPSGKIGLNQDDEMVDWLNYPIDEHMQHEYCPGFMPDLSGADASEFPADNNAVLSEKLKQVTEFKTLGGNGEVNRPRSSQLYPLLSHHSPTLTPSSSPISLDTSSFNASNTIENAFSGDLNPVSASYIDFPSMKTGRKDPGFSNKGSTFTNFPHFSRPAALVKANLQRIGAHQLTMERRQSNDKVSAATSGTPSISTSICSGNGLGKNMVSQEKLILVKVNVDSKALMETQVDDPLPTGQSGAICHETTFKNSKSYRKIIVEGTSDGEKTKEPIVATSSICSANCVERVLNDATHNLKRKCRDAEDSEYPSEDIEEEMVGAKISVPAQCGTSSKRSRAAEVHNLSERKRRDRINEKMRALQELIPNCNKVDKASMLDEAIEYLKMLQLQVQIMSMQTGMYMPPVMLPAGMQHMSAAHMVQYSHMSQGVGMGMGMNYGAGVVDVNGGSPGFPIMQVPPMQGAHYPKIPVLGIPGQGSSMSIPCAPLMHLSGPTTKSSSPLNASGPAGPFKFLDSAQLSTSEDPMHNPNSQMFRDNIMNESANQPQSTNSVIQHANALTHTGDRAPENVTSGNGSINFPNKNETNS